MAIHHHHHYDTSYESYEPASAASVFIAALGLMLLLFLVVVLLWAPWSAAGDSTGAVPARNQPTQLQPAGSAAPDGIQIVPSAPQNPGSAGGR